MMQEQVLERLELNEMEVDEMDFVPTLEALEKEKEFEKNWRWWKSVNFWMHFGIDVRNYYLPLLRSPQFWIVTVITIIVTGILIDPDFMESLLQDSFIATSLLIIVFNVINPLVAFFRQRKEKAQKDLHECALEKLQSPTSQTSVSREGNPPNFIFPFGEAAGLVEETEIAWKESKSEAAKAIVAFGAVVSAVYFLDKITKRR